LYFLFYQRKNTFNAITLTESRCAIDQNKTAFTNLTMQLKTLHNITQTNNIQLSTSLCN